MDTKTIGPTIHEGLPDLRDGAPPDRMWYMTPVPCRMLKHLMGLSKAAVYRMLTRGDLTVATIFNTKYVRLGELPQTVRCYYVELLFNPEALFESENIIYRPNTILKATGISKRMLYYNIKTGRIKVEYLPSGRYIYPHWGLKEEWKDDVRDQYFYETYGDNENGTF